MGPTETTRRIAGLRDSQWIIRGWHVAWWVLRWKLLVHFFGNRRCARSAGGRRDSSGRLTASPVLQRDLRGTQECLGASLDRTSANRLGGVAQRKLTLFLRP